jgi:hypothetical protein
MARRWTSGAWASSSTFCCAGTLHSTTPTRCVSFCLPAAAALLPRTLLCFSLHGSSCPSLGFFGPQNKLFDIIKAGQYEFDEADWKDISEEAKDLIRHMLVRLCGEGCVCQGV